MLSHSCLYLVDPPSPCPCNLLPTLSISHRGCLLFLMVGCMCLITLNCGPSVEIKEHEDNRPHGHVEANIWRWKTIKLFQRKQDNYYWIDLNNHATMIIINYIWVHVLTWVDQQLITCFLFFFFPWRLSQFRKKYTLEEIKNSRMIFDPLTMLQCW